MLGKEQTKDQPKQAEHGVCLLMMKFTETIAIRHTSSTMNMLLWIFVNHRQRGDAENKIKALKTDFGVESFNLKEFYPTEAALLFQ